MPRLFNLIVSHTPGRAGYHEALRYLRAYLPQARVFYTRQSIILLRVPDPYDAVRVLIEKLPPDSPILRAIPVDEVTLPKLEHVVRVVKELYPRKIPVDATFAVKVEGRLESTDGVVSRIEAQRVIGAVIERKVNLKSPDYLVLVKVVKLEESTAYAAITIAPPAMIYSKARMGG